MTHDCFCPCGQVSCRREQVLGKFQLTQADRGGKAPCFTLMQNLSLFPYALPISFQTWSVEGEKTPGVLPILGLYHTHKRGIQQLARIRTISLERDLGTRLAQSSHFVDEEMESSRDKVWEFQAFESNSSAPVGRAPDLPGTTLTLLTGGFLLCGTQRPPLRLS